MSPAPYDIVCIEGCDFCHPFFCCDVNGADGELIQDVPPENRGLRFVVSVLSCALSSFWVKPDSFTIPGCPHPIFSEHLSRFLPLLAEPGNSTLSEEKKKKGKKNSKASEMQSLSDSSRCAP